MERTSSIRDFGAGPHRFRDPRRAGAWSKRLGSLMGSSQPDDALIAHYRRAHFQGDPAADALVEWMHEVGVREGMATFDRALEHGLRDLADPPDPVRAFFEEIEAVPAWVDRSAFARACRVAEGAALGHGYVLFSLSLLAGYVSAGVTKTLAATGELERMAPRRVAETSKFVNDVYGSQTMARESDGFKSTVRVRIMHAFVRRKLLRAGWDTERWGVPINQADMAGTVLSFSITYLLGLRMLGFIVARRDRKALIQLWRYVGRLLGVHETLLAASEGESMRLLWLAASSQEGPDADGRALAQALLAVPAAYGGEGRVGGMLGAFDAAFCAGLTRFFLGDDVADRLGLPDRRGSTRCWPSPPRTCAASSSRARFRARRAPRRSSAARSTTTGCSDCSRAGRSSSRRAPLRARERSAVVWRRAPC
jgi:hypothetical protein